MLQEMEPLHLEQQLELRQRQLQEIAGTFRVSYAMYPVSVAQWQTRTQLRYIRFRKRSRSCSFMSPRGGKIRWKDTGRKRSRVPSADPLLCLSTPISREIYPTELYVFGFD